MIIEKVDLPALVMVTAFTVNLIVSFWFGGLIQFKEVGWVLFFSGSLFFIYVVFYLRSGFFGNVLPVLDFLITDGPYKFCRHPLYFSFILLVFGFDLLFGSIVGIVYTVVISIPTVIYRGKAEERSLKTRFGEEWDNYADKVGFLLPKFREHQ
jgi:protein-S-isoprenylcysteine O-methyltransferase Ste14